MVTSTSHLRPLGLCLPSALPAASLVSSHDTQPLYKPRRPGCSAPRSHSALVCHCSPGNKFIFRVYFKAKLQRSLLDACQQGWGGGSRHHLVGASYLGKASNVDFQDSLVFSPKEVMYTAIVFWFFFFGFFGRAPRHVGSLFPDQGSDLHSLYWKHGVLATRPPGKSNSPCLCPCVQLH